MFLSLCGEDVLQACTSNIDVMQNNNSLPTHLDSSVVCNLKEQTPLLQSHHPLTQFFSLFPDERNAMDSAMQILAKLAIILSESDHENPEEVRLAMQGFRNLYSSFEEYHNQRF